MFWIWFLIFIFISIGFLILFFTVNMRTIYDGLKTGLNVTTKVVDRSIENSKYTRIGKLIEYTDELIISSNIKLYVPYNVLIHFLICFATSTLTFLWISQYMKFLVSLLFSVIGLIIPYLILNIISNIMIFKMQKHSVDFLILLKNQYKSTGNIFTAFDNTKEDCEEPFKTYIDIMVYEYKNKINPITCIDNFINKIRYHELKLFMINFKIAYINGGDIEGLIDEFINEIDNLNDDSDKEDLEDLMLNTGLYFLIFINFMVIHFILNGVYKNDIVNTFYGQAVFLLDVAIVVYIMYMTLKKS